ncbi:MAG: hypothetical protein KA419_11575 [Acidobacteria bacterium]|nr:hypothetical protein [Acidobacteriota bacterium]
MDRETLKILFYLGELLFALGLICVLLYFRRRSRRLLEASWRGFALRRGLSFARSERPYGMTLAGCFEGVPVTVKLERIGIRHEVLQPVYEAPFSVFWPEGVEVHSRKKGWQYAYQAPRAGDPAVDELMVFKAPDPRVVPWLVANAGVRQALVAFFAGEGKTQRKVSSGGARIQDIPEVRDPARLTAQLEALAAFVRAVNAAGARGG